MPLHGLRVASATALCFLATSAFTAEAVAAPSSAREQALDRSARGLDACLTRGRACTAERRRLQLAGAKAAAPHGRAWQVTERAPLVTVRGQSLTWKAVRGSSSYLVAATAAGRAATYDVVRGTTVSPAPVAGHTRTYRIRGLATGSAWSAAKTISFAKATLATTGVAPAPFAAAAAAPSPAPVAAAAAAVTQLPAAVAAAVPVLPAASPRPGPRVGVTAAALTYSVPFVKELGARSARMEFAITTPIAEIAKIVGDFADAGIQANLLAGFPGRRLPTAAEAVQLGRWAATFGPGGSFWAGKGYPASLAVDRIEYGNEASSSWHYSELDGIEDWPHSPKYAAMAESYGRTFKAAAVSVRTANPRVRLLAVADVAGRWSAWMDGLFRAVPDLGTYVGGWVAHPYGRDWSRGVDDALQQAREHGASDAIPLYLTETGIASDDGRCLDDNYGWDPCMTYAEAADALTTSVRSMVERYGSRLAEIDIYTAHDLRLPGDSNSREAYFGGLDLRGEAKGAYTTAVRALLAP